MSGYEEILYSRRTLPDQPLRGRSAKHSRSQGFMVSSSGVLYQKHSSLNSFSGSPNAPNGPPPIFGLLVGLVQWTAKTLFSGLVQILDGLVHGLDGLCSFVLDQSRHLDGLVGPLGALGSPFCQIRPMSQAHQARATKMKGSFFRSNSFSKLHLLG